MSKHAENGARSMRCRIGWHRRWDRLGFGTDGEARVWVGTCVRCGDPYRVTRPVQSDRGSVDTAYLWLSSTAVGCGCLMLLAPVFAWIVGALIVAMVVAAIACVVGGGERR